ncbi:hypothetical protein ACSBR1_031271 [Camellia fascicularis]
MKTWSALSISHSPMDKPNQISEATQERMGDDDEWEELLKTLPKVKLPNGRDMFLYKEYWYPYIHGIFSFQQHFKAQNSDLILASLPKAGTTWLKALTFAIANRNNYSPSENPLLTTNPHGLVPFLDNAVYGKNPFFKLDDFPSPRILATHVPYSALPSSIGDSTCRVIYVCRNPLDQFISFCHYVAKLLKNPLNPSLMEENFNLMCRGVSPYGPFWDHVLGYWKANQERPDKVLFLKYEDMKEDPISHFKVLAKFMGFPLSVEEDRQGVVEEILKLCSLDNLKDLEVNKIHKNDVGHPNSAYFRKGDVGDWANYLTPSMAERMNKLMEEKFSDTGLNFKFY